MSVADSANVDLDTIIKKSQDKSWKTLLPDERQLLLTAFLPSQPLIFRSKAYIALSASCQHLRESTPTSKRQESNTPTEAIVNVFSQSLISKLGETTEREVLAGLTFLTALFQIDHQAAAAILLQEGVYDILEDIPDILPSSPPVSLALAHVIAQAAGHKSSRAVISGQAVQWLQGRAQKKEDNALRAAAAVALVKLNNGNAADAASNPLSSVSASGPTRDGPAGGGDEELAKLMQGLILDAPTSSPSTSIQDAVEGLAYLSVDPTVKELLSSDEKFLSRFFAIVPRRKGLWSDSAEDVGMTPVYGTVLTIANICAYRPHFSEEESQIAKLQKLAKAPANSSDAGSKKPGVQQEGNKLDDREYVLPRCRRLLKAGVMDALTSAVKATDSRAVRLTVGRALLSLIEDNDSRGKVLQSGGAKTLMAIIQASLSSAPRRSSQLDITDLVPIQALAKLTITASPVQVFGPQAGASYDAIRPLTFMLTHPSSTLLQQFEAIMALTNLASASPEIAEKVASADGLLNQVELLMLEDHTLVRRASVELICNLIAGSDTIFDKYGGAAGEASKRKLQVLVALCDVDDLKSRMAASGAVATVTASPVACRHLLELQREKHRVLPILGQLVDPTIVPPSDESGIEEVEEAEATVTDPGLVHRGVVCLRNLFVGIKEDSGGSKQLSEEAQKIGLVGALAKVFRDHSADRSSPILRPVAETIKCMMENGIPIQP